MVHMRLRQTCLHEQGFLPIHAVPAVRSVQVHNILGRILAAKRVEAEQPPAPGAAACPGPGGGGVAAAERRERYMLCALQCLIEAAKKYETASAPVRWGWCRWELVLASSFPRSSPKPRHGSLEVAGDEALPRPPAALS